MKPHKAQLLIGLSALDTLVSDKGLSHDILISRTYRAPILPPLFILILIIYETNMSAAKGTTDQIAVTDLSGPEGTVAKELARAAATYGFVYIRSLGKDIPLESIDGTFALVRPR